MPDPKMKMIHIDEYLVINTNTGGKKWLSKPPSKPRMTEFVIHIKGSIKYPEMYILDFGELTIEDAEAHAQAQMG